MSGSEFFDESKAKSYLGIAVHIPAGTAVLARRQVGELILPGQRSIHLKDESDSRKRKIVDALAELATAGVAATVYDAGRERSQFERRQFVLKSWVPDSLARGASRLVLDRDEGLVIADRQRLIELLRTAGAEERVVYEHRSRHEERLLAFPDAVAWCWAKGGDWRRRIEPLVGDVRHV